jgi:Ran GTPase-activating protein (RanGAP) involved in mRNA processing and transport
MTISCDLNNNTTTKSLDDYVDQNVLQRIIFFLPFKERVKVERVNQSWRKASLHCNAKTTTALSLIGYKTNKNFNQNFCSTPSHRIYKLFDIIVRSDSLDDLEKVLKRVPRLKSLHLKPDETEAILRDGEAVLIPRLLPDLEHFSLSDDKTGGNVYDDLIDLINQMPNLVHLEMKFPFREGTGKSQMLQENMIIKDALTITKDQLEILSTNAPLSLTNCKLISNACSRLRKLSVIGSSIPSNGLAALMTSGICRGKYLRSFNITIDSEDQLKTIAKSMLCLHHFYVIIDVPDVHDITCIGQLKNLRSLFISSYKNDVLDSGLVMVFIGCKKLTSLIINGEVSDKSFELLSDFVCNVKRIELNNGNGALLGDRTMYAFTKLDHLNSLSIWSIDCSDGSMIAFLESQKRLHFLRIRRSNTLTKAILPACIELARRAKNKNLVEIFLPASLKQYWPQYEEFSLPRNLVMKFEADHYYPRKSVISIF